MNVSEITDETLCAYLDDEMSVEQRAAFEKLLAAEPGARVRLERFQQVDARVRMALSMPVAHENDPLMDLLRVPAESVPSNVHPITQNAAKKPQRFGQIALALAASLLGVAIGVSLRTNTTGAVNLDPTLVSQPNLLVALNTMASGSERDGVRMVLSFRQADQSACRQFELAGSNQATEGVACRSKGQWRLKVLAASASDGAYRTAGGSELIDKVIDGIDASGALSADEEKKLISANWR